MKQTHAKVYDRIRAAYPDFHPNDLGFSKMAETICYTLRRILVKQNIFD